MRKFNGKKEIAKVFLVSISAVYILLVYGKRKLEQFQKCRRGSNRNIISNRSKFFLLRTRYDVSEESSRTTSKGDPATNSVLGGTERGTEERREEKARGREREREKRKKGWRRAKPETSTVRNLFHEYSPLGQRKHFCEGSEVVFLACIARHRSWISCAAKPQATSFLVAIGIVAFFNVPGAFPTFRREGSFPPRSETTRLSHFLFQFFVSSSLRSFRLSTRILTFT